MRTAFSCLLLLLCLCGISAADATYSFRYVGFSADVSSLQTCTSLSTAKAESLNLIDSLGATASPLFVTACRNGSDLGLCRVCRPDLSNGSCPTVRVSSPSEVIAEWNSSSNASVQCKLLKAGQLPETTLQNAVQRSGIDESAVKVQTVTRSSNGDSTDRGLRSWLYRIEHRLPGLQAPETTRTWFSLANMSGRLFVSASEPAVVLSANDVHLFSPQNPIRVHLGFDSTGAGTEPVVINFADSRDDFTDKPAMSDFGFPVELLSTQEGKQFLRREDGTIIAMPAVVTHPFEQGHFRGDVLVEVRQDRFPSLLVPVAIAFLSLLFVIAFLYFAEIPNKLRIGIILGCVSVLCAYRVVAGALYYMDDPSSFRRFLEFLNMAGEIVLIPFTALAISLLLATTSFTRRRWMEAAGALIAGKAGWLLIIFLLAPGHTLSGDTFRFLIAQSFWLPIGAALASAGILLYRFAENAQGDLRSTLRRVLPLLILILLRIVFIGERAFGLLLDAIYLPLLALLLSAVARRSRGGDYALAVLFVTVCATLTAAIINDWGLLFTLVLFFLVLFAFGSGYLQRNGIARVALAALAVAALGAWLILFPLPMYTELVTRLFVPAAKSSAALDPSLRYVNASNNALRLLFYSNRSLLETVPSRNARAVLEDQWEIEQGIQPLRVAQRGRLWWGSGYSFHGASRLYGRRVADDLLLWFYIRGPFGVPGLFLLFVLYGIIMIAVAYHNHGDPLAIHSAAWLTSLGWFMIGGTISANPFSGKWIPFLHLSSSSERLMSFTLLILLLYGLLKTTAEAAAVIHKRQEHRPSGRWALWFSGLLVGYMLLSILLEPRRFQQTSLDSSRDWKAPEHLFAAMASDHWKIECKKVNGINVCGAYNDAAKTGSAACLLAREGESSCEKAMTAKDGPPAELRDFAPYWNALSASGLLNRLYSYQEDNLPSVRTPLRFTQTDNSKTLIVGDSRESLGSVPPGFLALEIRGRKKYAGPVCTLRSEQDREVTLAPGDAFDLCRGTNETAAPGAMTLQCGDAPLFHVYSLDDQNSSAWLLFNVFHERAGAPNFDLQWGSMHINSGQMIYLRFDHPEDPALRIVKTDSAGKQRGSWTFRWTKMESGNVLARSTLLNGRPDWNFDPLNRWWIERIVSTVSAHMRDHPDQSIQNEVNCEKDDVTGNCVIHLTLDTDLNRTMSSTLDDFMKDDQESQVRNHLASAHRVSLGSGVHETGHVDAPQRASVAVVDINTGEVYAAASYPSGTWVDPEKRVPKEVVRRFLGANATPQLKEALETRVRRLVTDEGNQNFVTSVIGSAWKPLLLGSLAPDSADGVQDHASQLFTLQIEPHLAGEVADVQKNEGCSDPHSECILGLPMWPYGIESAGRHGGSQERIDSRSFILDSCNKYAVVLGTLSVCDWSAQQVSSAPPCYWADERDEFWVQGHEYHALPAGCDRAVDYPRGSSSTCSGSLSFKPAAMPETPLGRRVASMFDVHLYTPTSQQEERYDSTLFAGLLRNDPKFDLPVVEQTNLLLSEAAASSHFRPFFLGNGENQWTPLKLAEAYGRIATNRRLQVEVFPRRYESAEILKGAEEKKRMTELIGSLSLQRSASWVKPFLPPELQNEQDVILLDGYKLRMLSKTGTALRGEQYRDSAVFSAVLEPFGIKEQADPFAKRGLAVVIMIADSPAPGTAAASRNAVRLFARLWPDLNALLKRMATEATPVK